MEFHLAQWTWTTNDPTMRQPHWRIPGASGLVDIRPMAGRSAQGGSPIGFALCTSSRPIDGVSLGTFTRIEDATVTTAMRDAWESEVGYRPSGDRLSDMLWDQLTNGSDPTGDAAAKPLMPGCDGTLQLHLQNARIKYDRFYWGVHSHTNRVQDVLRRQFRDMWERTNGDDHCRRVLDFTCKKYHVEEWREFVPLDLQQHVPGRLPHRTTIQDLFNRGDESLDAGPWVEVAGNWSVDTNEVTCSGAGWNLARHTTALSSDDHWASAVIQGTAAYPGPACRVPNTGAVTFYQCSTDGTLWLFSLIAGSQSNLASEASHTGVSGHVYKVQADGSTIKAFIDTGSGFVEELSVTDTGITGNLYCGLADETGSAQVLDTFNASDLVTDSIMPQGCM